jgi:hypothetical protein
VVGNLLSSYAKEAHGYKQGFLQKALYDIPKEHFDIRDALRNGDKESLIGCLENRLSTLNNAEKRQVFNKINRTTIMTSFSEYSEHFSNPNDVLVISFLPIAILKSLTTIHDIPIENVFKPSELILGVASLVTDSNFCPHCAKSSSAESEHCITCGREFPLLECSNCETINPPQARFCMSCGQER